MQRLLANLDLLASHDMPALLRAVGCDREDLADMLAELRQLDPKPGLAFDTEPVEAVVPDVFVRSGPDGADLELLDVIWHEDVATRFSHIVIGSGDGTFVNAAQALSDGGVWVTVVSRWGSLSPRLAHAARDVVYLDTPPRAA